MLRVKNYNEHTLFKSNEVYIQDIMGHTGQPKTRCATWAKLAYTYTTVKTRYLAAKSRKEKQIYISVT